MPNTTTTKTFYETFDELQERYNDLRAKEEVCSELSIYAEKQLNDSSDTKNAKIDADTLDTIANVLIPAIKQSEEKKDELISVTTMQKMGDTLLRKTAETLTIEILIQKANDLKKEALTLNKAVHSAANDLGEEGIATPSIIADFFSVTSGESQTSDEAQASAPSEAAAAAAAAADGQVASTDGTNHENKPKRDIEKLIEDAKSLINDFLNHQWALQRVTIANAQPNPIKRAVWTYGLSGLIWYPARIVGSTWTFIKGGATAVADNASNYSNDRYRNQAGQKTLWTNQTVVRSIPSSQLYGDAARATENPAPAPARATENPAPALAAENPAPATETPAQAQAKQKPASAKARGNPAPAPATETPAPATETPAPAPATETPAPALAAVGLM